MHGERVDGNDLEAVLEASERLLARPRDECRPAVLEAMTYRYRGHSVAYAGLDYRTKEEIERRRAEHDPIRMIADRLKQRGELSDADEQRSEQAQRRRVADAVAYAADSPAPTQDTLAEHIYADPRFTQQFARMRPGSPFGESELVFGRGLAP